MSDGAAPTPAHTNMVRNIVVGVTTTILGSTAVYFLGFHNNSSGPSSHDFLVVKEATTQAWKSYVALENIEYKNSLLLNENLKNLNGLDNFKEELSKESKKFVGDMEGILKNSDIDDALTSLLKRRLDAEKEAMDKWNIFFDECKNITNTTAAGEEQTQKVTAALNKMQIAGDMIVKRAKIEITDLSKSLTEKYGQAFSTTELMLFKEETAADKKDDKNVPEKKDDKNIPVINTDNNVVTTDERKKFVGEWDYQVGVIRFSDNGRMDMQGNNGGQSVSGTWQYSNNQISISYPNEYGVTVTFVYNLFYVQPNSFTMQLVGNPNFVYHLQRNTGNYNN